MIFTIFIHDFKTLEKHKKSQKTDMLASYDLLWYIYIKKFEKMKFFFDFLKKLFVQFLSKFWNFKPKGDLIKVKLETPNFYNVHSTSFRAFFSIAFSYFQKKTEIVLPNSIGFRGGALYLKNIHNFLKVIIDRPTQNFLLRCFVDLHEKHR